MALNNALYTTLSNSGIPHEAALLLADPAKDTISGVAVPNAAGATPTAAEFNALLASLRTAGVINP